MNYSLLGAIDVYSILLIVISILLGAAVLFAVIAKMLVWIRYSTYNSKKTENGLTAQQTALLFLQKLNMHEVEVKKLNWVSAFIYGNHYNARRKTIYLRGNIFDKASVTATALALQKVGLAILDRNGDKKLKTRSFLQPIVILAPILFVPLSIVGILLDLVLFRNIGIVSVIFIGFAGLFYIAAFIVTVLAIPVEKNANKVALEMLTQTNLLSDVETSYVQKIFKTYLISYIADFIVSLLYLIKYILKIVSIAGRKGVRR
jgi:Zn-dependent membrane protease YugP